MGYYVEPVLSRTTRSRTTISPPPRREGLRPRRAAGDGEERRPPRAEGLDPLPLPCTPLFGDLDMALIPNVVADATLSSLFLSLECLN